MKKSFRKTLLLIAAITTAIICLAFSASAKTVAATGQCGNNVYWKYDSTTKELVISGSGDMNYYGVGGLPYNNSSPFYDSDIESVTINDGITSVRSLLFQSCDNLTSITIPDSVIEISSSRLIADTAFYNNPSNWDNGVLYIGNHLIDVQASVSGVYAIKQGTLSIAGNAFRSSNVTHIIIPDGVKSICDYAFHSKLISITIPKSITKINEYAFYNCADLEDVYYTGSQAQWKKISINDSLGYLTNATIHYNSCPHINIINSPQQNPTCTDFGYSEGTYCLDCKKWIEGHEETEKLPHSFTKYLYDENAGCTVDGTKTSKCDNCEERSTIPAEDTKINHKNKIEQPQQNPTCSSIGYTAGTYCPDCETWLSGHEEIPAEHVDINSNKFCNICGEYTEELMRSDKCGANVTYKWYKDGTVIISGSGEMKYYDDHQSPFYKSNIKSAIIKNGVTTLSSSLFSTCENLESVIIPDSVTLINFSTFYMCTGLISISIPSSVTEIGDYAFGYCYNLTDVYYAGTMTQWKKINIGSGNALLTNAKIHYEGCKNIKEYPEQKPTCTAVGYTAGAYCSDCKTWHSGHEAISAIPHVFTTYTSDKNATVIADGTKSALCDYGCGNKKTVTDKGSKLTLGGPSNLKATQTTSSVTLTWSKAKNATGYRIYYKLLGDITWRQCISYTTATTYTFKNLPAGTSYSFAVKSVGKVGSTYLYGSYVTIDTATKAVKPSKVTATQTTSSITLSWPICKNATGYRIYYKSGNTWKISVSSTTATSHTYTNLKAGAKYTFAVRPYIKNGDAVIWSDYIEFMTATKPSSIATKTSSTTKGKITVSWNAVNGADGYQVYYKTGNGSYKLYKVYSKAGTLNFSNLKSGTSYTFVVRAGIRTSGGNIYGGYTASTVKVK